VSADILVPNIANPQELNRYSYARNNPLRYTDPSGHCAPVCIAVALVVAVWAIFAPYNASPVGDNSTRISDVEVYGNVARDAAIAYTGARILAASTTAVATSLCLNDGDCTNEARYILQTNKNNEQMLSTNPANAAVRDLLDQASKIRGIDKYMGLDRREINDFLGEHSKMLADAFKGREGISLKDVPVEKLKAYAAAAKSAIERGIDRSWNEAVGMMEQEWRLQAILKALKELGE
jgi:hypothetical protein